MPHSCCQISLCGKAPFSLRASHHCLVSSVDLLPNDPLTFPFIENCPVPANFQPFLPVLTARTHLCPEPHIPVSSRHTQGSLEPCSSLCSLDAVLPSLPQDPALVWKNLSLHNNSISGNLMVQYCTSSSPPVPPHLPLTL